MGGLGETISTKMANAGYRVTVTYSPSNKTSAKWIADMKGKGYEFKAYPCDVTDFESCKDSTGRIVTEVGPVDILVNNAARLMPFPSCAREVGIMLKLILFVLLAVSQNWTLSGPAEALTQQEIVRELIGAPVYSMDGHEVGTVADIALDADQEFDTLLMRTSRRLGFGERIVRVPSAAFIALRGTVLDLPAESMDALVGHSAEETVRNER
jgi:NAD(P)-dependent dehydrogenase (short-subunit alcohol dehydrogenase family)